MEIANRAPAFLQIAKAHLRLLRPRQWVKSFIAIPIGPILFMDNVTPEDMRGIAATILLFVIAASAVYVLNDLSDIERDRQHPSKRMRPLAAGLVGRRTAYAMIAALGAAGTVIASQVPLTVTGLVVLYVSINIMYSLHLKHIPVVELLVVATGFVIRTAVGFLAASISMAPFVLATVFSVSLMMVVGKRKAELCRLGSASDYRPVLLNYSESLLGAYLIISAVSVVFCGTLALFSIFSEMALVILFTISLPFLVFLVLHYLMLAFVGHEAGNPTNLVLTDRTLHVALLSWAVIITAVVLITKTVPGYFLVFGRVN